MPTTRYSVGDQVVHVSTGKRGEVVEVDDVFVTVELPDGTTLERVYDTEFRPPNQEERFDDYMWWKTNELAEYVVELEDKIEELYEVEFFDPPTDLDGAIDLLNESVDAQWDNSDISNEDYEAMLAGIAVLTQIKKQRDEKNKKK